ncbi:choline BCCT transporter BetT [Nocardioides sp. CFH 31398]|uniref:choline BCCT transporter BetT n=1 Tax=Nocardioides sp. CFH 31398 TaxID=2919579 RepID=UPI001F05A58E|nr:choline BCCT transporter BetT [Nocardioides sp. CFH 31398]MCH1866304.1 choline BCCT transporter BetT [Nocardioides sp. CFH 31398]
MSAPTTEPPASSSAPKPADRYVAPPINWVVFGVAGGVTLAITLWAVVAPTNAEATLATVVGWVSNSLGWYYILLGTVVLGFVIFLACSRFGRVKLGPEHSQPQYGTFSWAAMLFAAGIGTDLMFFSVAEPITQYLAPPSGDPETVEAAREATVWTLFHYGITGWAMYAVMGVALAYFTYRMNLPLAIRSTLVPLFGKRMQGGLGDAVDSAAILGTIFGVATTLGIGVVQLNFGLYLLFGVPQNVAVQIAIAVVGVTGATISAITGVDRGIKRLSELNVWLTIFLAGWILVTGRTTYLLDAMVLNMGDFVRLFPDMTMQTFAFEDTGDWMSLWTLFFWAWWVAWACFVGLFLARISRGRTIRQVVAGALIIPFLYVLMWVSIFGNAAIDIIRQGNAEFGENALALPEVGFYSFLAEYPAFGFIAGLATFCGLLFYVSSADSGALVMATLSSRVVDTRTDGGRRLRIFWAVATGALTVALLLMGGIYTLQYATVIMGLPFAIVMVFVMVGLYRALRVEAYVEDTRAGVLQGAVSGRSDGGGRGTPWQARLRRVMAFPTAERAEEFLDEVALPALTEVAEELTETGVAASASRGVDPEGRPCVELVTESSSEAEPAFCYRVVHTDAAMPAYGGTMPSDRTTYSRLEVHLRLGGEGYDVMGYSHTQLIDDVLDQYERHLTFLRLHSDA